MPSPAPNARRATTWSLSARHDRHVYAGGFHLRPGFLTTVGNVISGAPGDEAPRSSTCTSSSTSGRRAASGRCTRLIYGVWTLAGSAVGASSGWRPAGATSWPCVDTFVLLQPVRVVGVQQGRSMAAAGGRSPTRLATWRPSLRARKPNTQHSVSRNAPIADVGALGTEVGTDEIEDSGRRPVEQWVDGVAMLRHGVLQSRQHRVAQDGDRLGGCGHVGHACATARSIRRRRRHPRRGRDAGNRAPQLGVPRVAMAPRRRTPAAPPGRKPPRPAAERLEQQLLDGDPPSGRDRGPRACRRVTSATPARPRRAPSPAHGRSGTRAASAATDRGLRACREWH